MSSVNFDFNAFRANLKATKPPYKCPVKDCEKVYRSLTGIQQHLDDHEVEFKKQLRLLNRGKRKGGIRYINNNNNTRSVCKLFNKQGNDNNEQLEKEFVEVELGGRLVQMDIYQPMKLVCTEKDKKLNNTTILKPDKFSYTGHSSTFELDIRTLPSSSVLPEAKFKILDCYVRRPQHLCRKQVGVSADEGEKNDSRVEKVEAVLYDADEEDLAWLELINEDQKKKGFPPVIRRSFEFVLDQFERLCHFEHRHNGVPGYTPSTRDEDAICSVCYDGECLPTNVILFCDLCNLAVHQECYGVPHIPEGPWVCRRCLLSPSKAVDCCLCPSKFGPMKQTDDGRWAHIVCALWIPDAGFANLVFLEPIDSLNRIAPARWKLTCQVCRRRAAGACIQCHKTSCYAAFHVTCAQQAGLHMKIEPLSPSSSGAHCPTFPTHKDFHRSQQQLRSVGTIASASASQQPASTFSIAQSNWRKTAYCDMHTPSPNNRHHRHDSGIAADDGDDKSGLNNNSSAYAVTPSKSSMRRARRLVTEGKEVLPLLSFPALDDKSFSQIKAYMGAEDGDHLVGRLHSYWLLKRKSRNGIPLVTHPNSYCLGKMDGSLMDECDDEGTKINNDINDNNNACNKNNSLGRRCDDDDDDDDDEEEEDGDDDDDNKSRPRVVANDDDSAIRNGRKEELKRMKKLRQELEMVRLLNELIKKRERLKMKQMEQHEIQLRYKLNPVYKLFQVLTETLKAKGLGSLLSDNYDDEEEDDDEETTGDDNDPTGDDNDSDDNTTLTTRRQMSQSYLKMSDILKKVEDLEYNSVQEFEQDFLRLCESRQLRRLKLTVRQRRKLVRLKMMGLTIIKKFMNDLKLLCTGKDQGDTSTADGDNHTRMNGIPKAGDVIMKLKLECNDDSDVHNYCNGQRDDDQTENDEHKSGDIHQPKLSASSLTTALPPPTSLSSSSSSSLPSLARPPLPSSLLHPPVLPFSAPSSTLLVSPLPANLSPSSSSSPSSPASSSVILKPLKKRQRHAYEGIINDTRQACGNVSRDVDIDLPRTSASIAGCLDDNGNLRLLAEAADSISSENSYSVDPNAENNNGLITINNSIVGSPKPSETHHSHSTVNPTADQSLGCNLISSQSEVVPNSNENQSKTIEACDSTTDWPSVEETESSRRKTTNQNQESSKARSNRSLKNSTTEVQIDHLKRKNSNKNLNSDEAGDENIDDLQYKNSKISKNETTEKMDGTKQEAIGRSGSSNGISSRRVTRVRTSESRDVDDFLIPLNHGDFVWAQCSKFPYYPAIIVNPSKPRNSGAGGSGYSSRRRDLNVGDVDPDVIPVPTLDVVKTNTDKEKYLVCFFDHKRTWQWISRSKLDPLGVDSGLDKKKIKEVKKSNTRRSIAEAYKRALGQRCTRYRENYARSLAAVLEL